ncbi:MAG: cobalamin-dependent protein [Thermacetogeniaceae bacterium]
MDDRLITAVEQLNEDKVMKLVKQRLLAGRDPVSLQEQIHLGMVKVGILYEKGEYFIADLIMAGEICKNVLKLIHFKPENQHSFKKCKVMLGTVQGDLHDIGKNIFASMIEAEGFEVIDLGIDVPPKVFVDNVKELKPQIVAMSGVLTLAVESMKKTVDAIVSAGLRNQVRILVGGNPVNRDSFKYIGADAFTNYADEGVAICNNWINSKI